MTDATSATPPQVLSEATKVLSDPTGCCSVCLVNEQLNDGNMIPCASGP
jgi:hypothetical protein